MFSIVIMKLMTTYGLAAFGILGLMIFLETGLVVTPFLPGDSMLFLAGAWLAAAGYNPWIIVLCFAVAAVAGDLLNFSLGSTIGLRMLKWRLVKKVVKPAQIAKTHAFFKKYGNSTILLGRFMPIIRTLVPFVAGVSQMKRRNFIFFNILGGITWVIIGVMAGFFFGNVTIIKQHFELLIIAIVVISLLPVIIASWRSRLQVKSN